MMMMMMNDADDDDDDWTNGRKWTFQGRERVVRAL